MNTPFVDVWHDILRARHEHDMPRATHIHMHPRDAAGLERDIHRSEHLRYQVRMGMGLELFGTRLSIQTGVAEGWLIVEAEYTLGGGHTLTMHRFRCLDHEDCSATPELGIACLRRPTETSAVAIRALHTVSQRHGEEP